MTASQPRGEAKRSARPTNITEQKMTASLPRDEEEVSTEPEEEMINATARTPS